MVVAELLLGEKTEGSTMKCSLAVVALAAAATMAAPAPTLAKVRHHHYRHFVPSYGYYPGPGYGYPIAPYGNAQPSYSSPYGTYPSWTYDPDPNLRAQLRSEFNRGVETPGNGR
jgi:hypothetical protein